VSCNAPGTAARRRLAWEFLDAIGHWRSLVQLDDATGGLERSGHVRLRTPAVGLAAAVGLGEVTTPLVWIRARVTRAAYDRAPRLRSVRTNTAPATQAQTVVEEIVGGSNGRRDQVHRLANAPVLAGTLVLEVSDGTTSEGWEVVDDLFGSGPDDRHVVLNRTTGEIRWGDGRRGAIPPGDPRNPNGNIVARTYRFGGTSAGQVPAGAITTMLRPVPGIDDSAVTNIAPSVGGRDEETLAEAKARAPQAIRSRSRAVIASDFEHLATQVGTVRRAKALPFAHPDFPGVEVPGAVTVVVVPEPTAAARGDLGPAPSQATLREVCTALDGARLVTTEVYVMAPTYHLVTVIADVVAEDDADLAAVKTEADAALDAWFDPIGGDDDGLGWPFGGDIAFSRVYARLGVPGVARVDRVTISLDGDEAPACTNVALPAGHLLVSGVHDVRPVYGTET
jgi:predicted phage baseplate assembly protein